MQGFELHKNNGLHVSIESKESVARALISRGDNQFVNHEYWQAEQSYRTALQSLSATKASSIDRAIIMKSISAACRMQGKLTEALRLNTLAEQLLLEKRRTLENLFLRPTPSEFLSARNHETEIFSKEYATGFLPAFLIGALLLSLASYNLLLM